MYYQITHITKYIYDEPASLCYNQAHLTPRSFVHPLFSQKCHASEIRIDPPQTDYNEHTDFFGNTVLYFTLRQPHTEMVVTATSQVSLEPTNGARVNQLVPELDWESVREQLQTSLEPDRLDARQFVLSSSQVTVFPALAQFAAPSFPAGQPILEAVNDLMKRIYRGFDFVPGVTTITTPLSEVLETRRGVCQDFAHLMVGCLRAQGLAARYVSGYIETLPPPGQEKLAGADASHAWCAVFVPEVGWVDFDPTNNLIPTEQHITLAWGRDFADVAPLKGVFFSHGQHKLQVSVDVARL